MTTEDPTSSMISQASSPRQKQPGCSPNLAPAKPVAFPGKKERKGKEDYYVDCVHCGLCLAQCPTYRELGFEADSPRGRMFLMRAVQEGTLSWNSRAADHIDLCLGCRACESACPAGVHYERLLEESRRQILQERPPGFWEKALRRVVFHSLFRAPWRLHAAFRLLRLYQISGIRRLLRSSGLLRLFSPKWAELEHLLPDIPASRSLLQKGIIYPAKGKCRYRVAFFTGCVMDETMADIQRATVEVLQENGCEVLVPRGQVCCGAVHSHSGEMKAACRQMKTNVQLFSSLKVDSIISNAGGCGAVLKDYGRWAEDYNPLLLEKAGKVASQVEDISEFLARIGYRVPSARLEKRLGYDEPCHLVHGQKISAEPRKILQSLPGITWAEIPGADQCCGGAGTYNITQYDLSMRILEKKMQSIASAGAEVVATGNPVCLLQLRYGAKRFSIPVEFRHPAEILAELYRRETD